MSVQMIPRRRGAGAKKRARRFTAVMQEKLLISFIIVFLAFVGLTARLILITRENGEQYKKQVLSQQRYDSTVIPYRRGEILDSRGTSLAVSEKVYNVILDAKALLAEDAYEEPTLQALADNFDFDLGEIRNYLITNPGSQYRVLARRLPYEEIAGFQALLADPEAGTNIQGIWFEEEYKRNYPNNSLASDLIGFTTSDNNGLYGLEQFYNDVLAGTDGREYGYLNEDAELERTTVAAVHGNSIITTIDANIQAIVEKYLYKYNEENKNKFREGNGAVNVGCIIMEVNTGNILAMANYPNFDLNNTKNKDVLLGMPMVDREGKLGLPPLTFINEENLAAMDEETLNQNFNYLWKNFCISETYEPGSVIKPFTVAAGLESGAINGTETYECLGYLDLPDDRTIRCHNRFGDGMVSVQRGVEISCNVAMMKIAASIGRNDFVDFQHIFNFGLKTNVDLVGEARTAALVYNKDTLNTVELATCSFGQGFNASMIQVITAFCSLINGGNYYEPHIVQSIISPTGATVQNIDPRLLKQTISPETSDTIREFCNQVVLGPEGTGHTARPAGYQIGGKTGTAEMVPRDKTNYVVSFMGYAPIDNPELAIYVVVDRPNAQYQDDAKHATYIVKNILTEVLPYRKIYMTEELTDTERADLETLQKEIVSPILPGDGENPAGDGTGADAGDGADGSGSEGGGADDGSDADDSGSGGTEGEDPAADGEAPEKVWKDFPIDPETGYAIDPVTGDLVDPESGTTIGGSFTPEGEMGVLPPSGGIDTGPP